MDQPKKPKEAKPDVHVFQKGVAEQLSPHFISTEFDCLCTSPKCTTTYICRQLVDRLEDLRVYSNNHPIKITSGYRCSSHNQKIKGEKNSLHLYGLAADIKVKELTPNTLQIYADEIPFPGVGVYRYHVHVDFGKMGRRWKKL